MKAFFFFGVSISHIWGILILNIFIVYLTFKFNWASCIFGLPQWLSGKESVSNKGGLEDSSSISGSGRSLEEGMVTHSNILAWRITWTEDFGGLQSMGSQRVGHDLATKQ